MNRDDLLKRLEAQRKWRTLKSGDPAKRPPKGMTNRQITFLFYLIILIGAVVVSVFIGFFSWKISSFMEDAPVPSPMSENTPITTEDVPTADIEGQGDLTTTVCAGGFGTAKLHVRFEAGLSGEVRGYLNEGETVTVLTGEQGKPITKIEDGVSWTLIQSPINGWVSTSHLCK